MFPVDPASTVLKSSTFRLTESVLHSLGPLANCLKSDSPGFLATLVVKCEALPTMCVSSMLFPARPVWSQGKWSQVRLHQAYLCKHAANINLPTHGSTWLTLTCCWLDSKWAGMNTLWRIFAFSKLLSTRFPPGRLIEDIQIVFVVSWWMIVLSFIHKPRCPTAEAVRPNFRSKPLLY